MSLADKLPTEFVAVCGNSTADATITEESSSLLGLLKRQLKVQVAQIIRRSVNALLFEATTASAPQDWIVSQDLYKDLRLRKSVGETGSLVLLGEGNIPIGSAQLQCVTSVRDIIQDRYAIRAHGAIDIEFTQCANIAMLFNSLQPYLSAANLISQHIATSISSESGAASGRFSEEFCIELPILSAQMQSVVAAMAECTGRIGSVARYFTEPNRRKYYTSCFYFSLQGFVPSLNECLLELSRVVPNYQLNWLISLETELVDSPHRSFTPHLQFFLENLILLWSKYSSGAEVSVAYERKNRTDTADLGYINVAFQPRSPDLFLWRGESGPAPQSVAMACGWLVKMMGEFLNGVDRQARVECRLPAPSSTDAPRYVICLPCHFMPGYAWSKSSSDSQRSSAQSVYRIASTPRGAGAAGAKAKRDSMLRTSLGSIQERGIDSVWMQELAAVAAPRTRAQLRFSVQVGDSKGRGRRRSVCCDQMKLSPLSSPTNQALVKPTNLGLVADASAKSATMWAAGEAINNPPSPSPVAPVVPVDSTPPASQRTHSVLRSLIPTLFGALRSVFWSSSVSPQQPRDSADAVTSKNKASSATMRTTSRSTRHYLSLRFSQSLTRKALPT
eukprot:gene32701-39535_t